MPKSKVRKKDSSAHAADRHTPAKVQGPSHPVYLGVMFSLMLLGLVWLIVYYLAGDAIPFMGALQVWNFAIGFGMMIIGLMMTMRWH